MNSTTNNSGSFKQGGGQSSSSKGGWDSKPDRANWADTKAKIKNKWSMLSDSQLEGLENNFDRLPEQIQQTYGYSKQQADKEFSDFKMGLEGGYGKSQGREQRGSQPSGQSPGQKNQMGKDNKMNPFGAV